ncbi:cobyric acid synthase [Parvibaculaceae bacterium PLY_AMNH_Bact1]|nr:cobyric acid synthase [Parvibaculaceae bacterium PLY_AMNH_Bact1]
MTKALMLQGTGSDVGKSVLVAGLARAAVNRGLAVRPFKPQNMSNNAAVTVEGGEIGRAQWLQARACNVPPSIHMNPVLLKPQSDTGAQVVVQGRVWGTAEARDYQTRKKDLLASVLESFETLKRDADLILVEGAGSPAETNLRAGDIANMGFAAATGTPVVLIGDIDRGGVIASLVGTHAVLDSIDQGMIKGFLINKFRGDVSLFDDGMKEIAHRTGWQSLGVLPWVRAVADLPAEDAVVLERGQQKKAGQLKIAVPMLSRIANFDDVDPLAQEESVDLQFIPPGEPLPGDAALVILPGTKSTIADLEFFRAQGWDVDLQAHIRRGGWVLGLCGGFQMLGKHVNDPEGREGAAAMTPGLGLLDVATVMRPEKLLRTVTGRAATSGAPFSGYEIHIGETKGRDLERSFLEVEGAPHGAISEDGRIMGAYVHGLFENGAFRKDFLGGLGATSDGQDHDGKVDRALDRLAGAMEEALDIDGLLNLAAVPSG